MSDKGSLHPDRIAKALEWFMDEDYRLHVAQETADTSIAALRFIQQLQNKMGFTPTIADFGADVLKVLKGLKSLR